MDKITPITIETERLLDPGDPPAVFVHHPAGASDVFITCDHAGNLIPERLGTLGLEPLHLQHGFGALEGERGCDNHHRKGEQHHGHTVGIPDLVVEEREN